MCSENFCIPNINFLKEEENARSPLENDMNFNYVNTKNGGGEKKNLFFIRVVSRRTGSFRRTPVYYNTVISQRLARALLLPFGFSFFFFELRVE